MRRAAEGVRRGCGGGARGCGAGEKRLRSVCGAWSGCGGGAEGVRRGCGGAARLREREHARELGRLGRHVEGPLARLTRAVAGVMAAGGREQGRAAG